MTPITRVTRVNTSCFSLRLFAASPPDTKSAQLFPAAFHLLLSLATMFQSADTDVGGFALPAYHGTEWSVRPVGIPWVCGHGGLWHLVDIWQALCPPSWPQPVALLEFIAICGTFLCDCKLFEALLVGAERWRVLAVLSGQTDVPACLLKVIIMFGSHGPFTGACLFQEEH